MASMHNIVIQYAVPEKTPGPILLKRWAQAALPKKFRNTEITIRIVNIKEMTDLNTTYRGKKGPTNVLSFPFEMPDVAISKNEPHTLGDIIICRDVVNREAKEQNKKEKAHWAHMIIHGTLHLQGYDHVDEKDAVIMEKKEIRILKSLGFLNPYQLSDE